MGITEKQREQRKKYLGSSDMAAILGVDQFKNAYDVWLEKTGKLEESEENKVMIRGHLLEPAILNFAELELGPIERDPEKLEFFKEDLHLADHPDGLVIETHKPIEGKSIGAYSKEVWGAAETDEVPDRAIVQSHVHMICTEEDYCHVPVYLAYREFVMFGVPLDKKIADIICEKTVYFWDNYVVKDMPPEDILPSLAVVKRVHREPETVIDISLKVVEDWKDAKEQMKIVAANKKQAEAALLANLGTNEAGRLANGDMITYLQQNRKGYEVKPSTYRTLRFKKAK